ncbi:Aste57867_21671 [Aphanomyces stellatus]|uniref:Aste57867_21671 protein n=1 Tax=Aphanomyces stellatus TaxID=120398 RepID=A0A485LI54_9STRA|nr:hypothetical protein As57867_021602 [Aphanomyces stellatus]VFT98340.1 Aste57867_21671 [Aphanomyces stellatus]
MKAKSDCCQAHNLKNRQVSVASCLFPPGLVVSTKAYGSGPRSQYCQGGASRQMLQWTQPLRRLVDISRSLAEMVLQ